MPSRTNAKQQQWKQHFQHKAAFAFSSDWRSNVKVFIAGPYLVVKVYGKSVPLPGVSPAAAAMHAKAPINEVRPRTERGSGIGNAGHLSVCGSETAKAASMPRTPEENRRRHVKRKQTELQFLIHQNFSPDTAVFATLTFGQGGEDIDEVIRECQKLFQRLRRHVPDVKVVAVPERHEKGGWHLHLLLDRELPLRKSLAKPYIESGSIKSKSGSWEKLWTLGLVHQKRLNQGGNLGASIAAYVMKNASNEELAGHHTVWKAGNLAPPTEICGQDAVDMVRSLVNEDLAPTYGYHCDVNGFIETMDVFEFCLDPAAAMLNKAWWKIKNSA